MYAIKFLRRPIKIHKYTFIFGQTTYQKRYEIFWHLFVLQEQLFIARLDNIRMLAQYTGFSLIMHTTFFRYAMTDQQFVLKWHYHEATLLQNLPYLLENDILSDVTISVGAQHVKAHRIILAMCSVYFLQLFQVSRLDISKK